MDHINRLIKSKLLQSLKFSPIVYLNGPRQAGKSTLVQELSKKDFPAEYVTFDSTTQISAAVNSPETYLKERTGALIIDEVQLVPEIFRCLKIVVDELRQAREKKLHGLFLLTGSANIMALPKLSNPLVGRMSVMTLYPLSSAEAVGGSGDFIKRLFNQNFEQGAHQQKLINIIERATFPEISGAKPDERTHWFDAYITTILQRDVRALAEIEKLSAVPNLLRILANRAGGLMNDANIARDAGLNPVTQRNYKALLKMLFLTFEISPWYRNIGKRLVKSPKGYIIDTLLLCHLLQYNLSDLIKNRPELFGHVLENFVATELLKLITNDNKLELFHFRTSDNKEVDFVLEQTDGRLAAIEVKNRDRVDKSDFKGLETLQNLTGDDFVCGIVLYRGHDIVPFGEKLWAVPISNLWL
ncbi:MAG: ATP-binding protein [Legionella sp.]|nr:ATP-binding protein [Legionella sp.]